MPEIGVYEAMSTLRAVRRLRPDPIPDDVLRRVLEAATWAPTGGNRQPWRIIAVKDSARKERLGVLYRDVWEAFSKPYAAGFAKLPDDVREKQERMLRAGDYLAQNFEQSPVICIFCFNPDGMAITDAQLARPSVVGGGSVYPSVENLLLACRAEGLGCTLTTLLCVREPAVKELLNIPDGWGTAAAIPIGYPIHRGHGPISRRPIEELAFTDSWGEPLGQGAEVYGLEYGLRAVMRNMNGGAEHPTDDGSIADSAVPVVEANKAVLGEPMILVETCGTSEHIVSSAPHSDFSQGGSNSAILYAR